VGGGGGVGGWRRLVENFILLHFYKIDYSIDIKCCLLPY